MSNKCTANQAPISMCDFTGNPFVCHVRAALLCIGNRRRHLITNPARARPSSGEVPRAALFSNNECAACHPPCVCISTNARAACTAHTHTHRHINTQPLTPVLNAPCQINSHIALAHVADQQRTSRESAARTRFDCVVRYMRRL